MDHLCAPLLKCIQSYNLAGTALPGTEPVPWNTNWKSLVGKRKCFVKVSGSRFYLKSNHRLCRTRLKKEEKEEKKAKRLGHDLLI